MTQKIRCALIGPGNIGTDLLAKLQRSPVLEPVWMVGIDPDSDGLKRAREMGIKTTAEGVDGLLPHVLSDGVQIAFDATSAYVHAENSRKLNELGVSITMDEVEAEAHKDTADKKKPVGRPHIAAVLLRKGYVSSIKQAFDKYLAQGAPAYFDKERLTPQQALDLVRQSGGLPVLAHPVQLRTENDAQLERVVKDLVDLGLAGLETIHSDHDAELVEKYTALAKRYNLLTTGGSDFHGTNKKDISLGTARGRKVPRAFFDALVSRHHEARVKC